MSDDLRRHSGQILQLRRRTAALSLGAMGSLGMVCAYQFGLVEHLPEPRIRIFAADRVDASGEAYDLLTTPDAPLGMLGQAVTLVLAGMGNADRADERPWIPLVLAAKVSVDALSAVYLTLEQQSRHRRFCFWCVLAAAMNLATVPAVLPEASIALRRLINSR